MPELSSPRLRATARTCSRPRASWLRGGALPRCVKQLTGAALEPRCRTLRGNRYYLRDACAPKPAMEFALLVE